MSVYVNGAVRQILITTMITLGVKNFQTIYTVHYRSELWDHLFFDDCSNYLNLNSVCDEICTLNNVRAIKIKAIKIQVMVAATRKIWRINRITEVNVTGGPKCAIFLENFLINLHNLIYVISIALRRKSKAYFWAFVTWLHSNG